MEGTGIPSSRTRIPIDPHGLSSTLISGVMSFVQMSGMIFLLFFPDRVEGAERCQTGETHPFPAELAPTLVLW